MDTTLDLLDATLAYLDTPTRESCVRLIEIIYAVCDEVPEKFSPSQTFPL